MAEALSGLAVDPSPPASKPLKGAPARWRLRVGEYRVVYRILDDAVLILVIKIAHRSYVYKR
jgi:mRNA interferase RelE/StbE